MDDVADSTENRRDDRWHVGKEIPIALIAMLMIQSAGAIWWAATQSAKMDALTAMVAEFRAAQYTQNDAHRDLALTTLRIDDLVRRTELLETSVRGAK
jgi:hypothetical protein